MRKFVLAVVAAALLGMPGLEPAISHAASKQAKTSKAKKLEECNQRKTLDEEAQRTALVAASEASSTHSPSDWAGELPENWQELVKAAILERLKDPDSAQFKFEVEPSISVLPILQHDYSDKFYNECKTIGVKLPTMFTYMQTWEILVKVNAKNSFGGYVGYKEYDVRINKGRIVKVDVSIAEALKLVNN